MGSYYDPNERKYYITPQSVEAVIQEEIQRTNKSSAPSTSESFGSPVTHVKHPQSGTNGANEPKFHELEREIRDLKITNRAKDMFIDHLKSERSDFFDKLISANQMVGRLEIKLNQLDGRTMRGIEDFHDQQVNLQRRESCRLDFPADDSAKA